MTGSSAISWSFSKMSAQGRRCCLSLVTLCAVSPQVCRLPTESTYSPTPLLKLIHVWCKNARSDSAPRTYYNLKEKLQQRTEFHLLLLFLSEICVLFLPGISPSWPNERPTSQSVTSSATSLHFSWPRTRPRRPSPWWWTWLSPSPPRRILPPRKRRRSWVSMMPSFLSHRRAVWLSQVRVERNSFIHSNKKGSTIQCWNELLSGKKIVSHTYISGSGFKGKLNTDLYVNIVYITFWIIQLPM